MSKNAQSGRRLKLTVFLIKDGYTDLADFLDVANLKSVAVSGGGTEGTLFYRGGFQSKPPWVAIFEDIVGFDSSKIVNQSSRGLFTIKVAKRWFCFTFGYSRQLISESAIERNFGLIVTLNLGDPEAIKAIDKTNISHVALQCREQAGRDVSFDGFEFDTDIDLLKSITAKGPQVEGEEQDTYSGRDSICVYTRVELKSFADIAKRLLKAYENTAYLDRYPWIGKISQERDSGVIAQLNAALVAAINAEEVARIWLALPDVIVWEQTDGFAYRLATKAAKKAGPALHPDIDLDNWLAETGLKGAVTLPRLVDRKIYQCLKDDNEPNTWSVYRCLNAEVDLKGLKYILNDGDWYNVESGYVKDIDNFYKAIPTSNLILPNYGTRTEPKYLKEVSSALADITLMDRKLIMIGGGKSKIEFCDLFSKKKDIIHVKQYGGSSLLSHLFSQAVVSADCFLHEVDFRKTVNNHLPAGFKFTSPAVAPPPAEYTICMAIMSKVAGPLEIPFFSKVSMKHAVRSIQKMGFKVTKLKIDR
jgi:uncharacterized protein (TIGR04141 family)